MSSKISSRLPTTTRGRVGAALTVVTAAIAIVSGLVGVVQPAVGADPAAAGVPPATPVSVATVAARDINAWDEFSGRLEAVQRVDVRSRVAGAVQAIHFREGALVKTGDLLVSIDPAPYQAEVDRAAADVAAMSKPS